MTPRNDSERNQWIAAGLAVWLVAVLMGLDAAGFVDLCVWAAFCEVF